eukprot:gene31308-40680_t
MFIARTIIAVSLCSIYLPTIIYGATLPNRVIVTGAAGRTGSLVLKKLLEKPTLFSPFGIVRTEKSAKKLQKQLKSTPSETIVSDVTNSAALEETFLKYKAQTVILCTSAVPKIKIFSLLKVLILKLFRIAARPEFYFLKNGDPYNVDWLGAKNQIDAATRAGVQHFVFLSSMGGTQPENFLNTIGKVIGDELSGNILLWKRKAEEYLISACLGSGMKYTIIHPGGLLDKKGGVNQILMGFDDNLLQRKVRSIPRDDVADVCVQAILEPAAQNKAFDVIVDPDQPAPGSSDWNAFFSQPGTCKY